jgi:hypothetical protein
LIFRNRRLLLLKSIPYDVRLILIFKKSSPPKKKLSPETLKKKFEFDSVNLALKPQIFPEKKNPKKKIQTWLLKPKNQTNPAPADPKPFRLLECATLAIPRSVTAGSSP